MAYDILKRARAPLHVAEILGRIQSTFQVTDRALTQAAAA
jgi:hypothetical protein